MADEKRTQNVRGGNDDTPPAAAPPVRESKDSDATRPDAIHTNFGAPHVQPDPHSDTVMTMTDRTAAGPPGMQLPEGMGEFSPRAYFDAPSTYIVGERDIWASSIGQRVTSYTMRAASVSADGNGDKIVYEGTILSYHSGSGKVEPRTSGTAIGILLRRVNLRDADQDVPVVVGGAVRQDKLTDNGSLVVTPATAVVTALPGVFFTPTDI